MKPGGSALNPYAAAYVPLSKRQGYLGEEELQSANHHTRQVQHQQPHVARGYGVQGMGSYQAPQMGGYQAPQMGSYQSPQMSMPKTSSDTGYKQMRDEDLDMDMEIEYLLVTFSGLSHESINDVYLANNGDLDATIEMLTQLEIYSSEAQEYLPETLDIGDVPETAEPSTSTASKQKNAGNEAATSSTLSTLSSS